MESNLNEIFGLWFFSMFLMVGVALVFSCLVKKRRISLWRLKRDEKGMANIPMVALIPLVIFSVALVIETTQMSIAAIGVRSACAATTRSAIVWLANDRVASSRFDYQLTGGFLLKRHQLNRIKDAATHNLAPFATGLVPENEIPRGGGWLRVRNADAYVDQILQTHRGDAGKTFLRNQYLYADTAKVSIRVNEPRDPFDGGTYYSGWIFPAGLHYFGQQKKSYPHRFRSEVTVRIEYFVPFRTPVIGRLLGEKPWPGAKFYAKKIVAEYSLPKEGFQTESQRPGIHVFRK